MFHDMSVTRLSTCSGQAESEFLAFGGFDIIQTDLPPSRIFSFFSSLDSQSELWERMLLGPGVRGDLVGAFFLHLRNSCSSTYWFVDCL